MKKEEVVRQEEIDKALERLAQIHDPENMPTRQEVIAMLLRMKKRWGMATVH